MNEPEIKPFNVWGSTKKTTLRPIGEASGWKFLHAFEEWPEAEFWIESRMKLKSNRFKSFAIFQQHWVQVLKPDGQDARSARRWKDA